jgi:hypothetical protein
MTVERCVFHGSHLNVGYGCECIQCVFCISEGSFHVLFDVVKVRFDGRPAGPNRSVTLENEASTEVPRGRHLPKTKRLQPTPTFPTLSQLALPRDGAVVEYEKSTRQCPFLESSPTRVIRKLGRIAFESVVIVDQMAGGAEIECFVGYLASALLSRPNEARLRVAVASYNR